MKAKGKRQKAKGGYSVGDAVVLLPRTHSWDTLFQSLEQFEPGFKLERKQPKAQQKRAKLK